MIAYISMIIFPWPIALVAALDTIGRGVNDLERNIGDLMSQSRMDEA